MSFSLNLDWNIVSQQHEPQPGRVVPPHAARSQSIAPAHAPSFQIPSLQSLIEELKPLPRCSAILGACDDGFHLFIDLTDPQAGSLLIVGDRQCGKTRLARSILTSIALLNTPEQARYTLISPDYREIELLANQPHCYRAVSTYSDQAMQAVREMAEIASQRCAGRQHGPVMVLVIEDLAELSRCLDAEHTDLLAWLLRRGAESRIWTMATLQAESVQPVSKLVLRCFGNRLVGKVSSPDIAGYLSGGIPAPFEELIAGAQFSFFYDGEWVKCWIPRLDRHPIKTIQTLKV